MFRLSVNNRFASQAYDLHETLISRLILELR